MEISRDMTIQSLKISLEISLIRMRNRKKLKLSQHFTANSNTSKVPHSNLVNVLDILSQVFRSFLGRDSKAQADVV